ncbi:MAG: DNA topoisomerase VI subunit B [Candidatus Woesearchaeota archaeon]|jgi:DNA topoisomerase-6 subunit B|nr:DNA topoisomerase VI subunit B [Candidatus Woesearchaeota archaeon]MDP7622573.1 DNA topoisomerase VI subunit B [Candidatus Woesearchaeota archaeon]HJN57285.1 DNA topoisomerase VI subunit B [Candidatus Woesearchaeota archaeon]|tara:strand:+ start:14823 stop:16517 length:1695 start_codon:yes stop_codon:yes gene_type:complete
MEKNKDLKDNELNVPIAIELAKKQQEISVASFFEKNRHLLGFDNPRKSLLTTIKEAVDNSLDACEEGNVLPEINVEVIDMQNNRFRVIVEDNGPGIVKKQIPNIFAKLLYGSKFFKLSQSRGQQGIGISASVLYAQLTTGNPARITSKIGKKHDAHYYELHIDTHKNKPDIIKDETKTWNKDHGTRIELDLEGSYQKGDQSIDQYLKQTAIVNPHVTIIYTNPKAEQIIFPRASDKMPKKPIEIKPHPYGVELGVLMSMLKLTETRTLQSFLTNEFSRVGSGTAKQICENAALLTNTKPRNITREMTEKLIEGIKKTKIISPPVDCISPIGEELLEKGLKKEIDAEFYCATKRPPSVYRGNPFIIEAGIAYGGKQNSEESMKLFRYANRVPLQYQQGACAITRSVINTAWRNYGLSQSRGALPIGPITLALHIASVWVPFTSESKEAIAHYPEIIKEIKLALQEVGRKLASYVGKKRRVQFESKKRDYIQMFIPHVGEALKDLVNFNDSEEKKVEKLLAEILEKKRGKLEQVEAKNLEYDEEFANIGKEEKEDDQEEKNESKEK